MKQYINEIRRMQQLAGITEIKVSNPARLYDIGDKVYDINWHLYDDEPTLYTVTNRVENANELMVQGIPYMVDWNAYGDNELNNPWYELNYNDWFPESELTRRLNEIKVTDPSARRIIKIEPGRDTGMARGAIGLGYTITLSDGTIIDSDDEDLLDRYEEIRQGGRKTIEQLNNILVDKEYVDYDNIDEIKVTNPAGSFYLVIDHEDPTELELVSDEKDEAYYGYTSNGHALDNGIFTFSVTTFPINVEDEDIEFMSGEEIFSEYAPKIFKQLRDEGADWDADDEYIDVAISLDKLKELFPVR